MSETTPSLSRELTRQSAIRATTENSPLGELGRYNVLEAQEAAFAAKPFMDLALDLRDTYSKTDRHAYKHDLITGTGLGSLVSYAESRAHKAALEKNSPELTPAEIAVIEIFEAENEFFKSEQTIAEYDDEYSNSEEYLFDAMKVASDRIESASNLEEADKWGKMKAKLARYREYIYVPLATGENDPEGYEEFDPKSNVAVTLLEIANKSDGELMDVDDILNVRNVKKNTRRMKELTEMNNFLIEIYAQHAKGQEYKGLSDDEVAAWTARIAKISTRSASTPHESDSGQEASNRDHDPHYNIVESVPKAKDLIYSDPNYLAKLIDESEAYAKFGAKVLDTSNKEIIGHLRLIERGIPEVRQAVKNWGEKSGMGFREYIEAVIEGDIDADKDQLIVAHSARTMLRNYFWREQAMARRMAKKINNKSEHGDVDKAFSASFFSS